MKTYIKTYLKTGFILPFKSSASAPILFDKKPDDSLWVYVNYQGLNNLTIKNQYPLSFIEKALDWLNRAKQFTQLNLTSAYHQMRIKEGDEWKTVFKTRYGYFEYQVMTFGLSNAPASFQGYINKILAKKLNVFVLVYLDDILIYIEDESQSHVKAMQWVLNLLLKNGFFTNLKNCQFHHDEVRILRYVVSAQEVQIENKRIQAMRNRLKSKSVKDIQVFLGFANFYQHFI